MVFSKNQLSLPTTYSKNRARSLNQEVKMSQTHLVPNPFLTLMAKYFPRNKTEHAVHSLAAGQGYLKKNSAGNMCNVT